MTVFEAVYLEYLTLDHLKERLAALLDIGTSQIAQVLIHGPSDIQVIVTDSVSIYLAVQPNIIFI